MAAPALAPQIVVDPEIRFGKPIIAGARVPVELVVAKLGGGMSLDEIGFEYDLTDAQMRAAVAYAAHGRVSA